MRKLRHNDVVNPRHREENGGFDPGRVWRRIDDDHVQVVFCGLHVEIYREVDLVLRNDYRGRWLQPGTMLNRHGTNWRWYPMTSMKRLKTNAKRYNAHFGGYSRRYDHHWTKEEQQAALADRKVTNIRQ